MCSCALLRDYYFSSHYKKCYIYRLFGLNILISVLVPAWHIQNYKDFTVCSLDSAFTK